MFFSSRYLLGVGADPNLKGTGSSALHQARSAEIASVLLEAGAEKDKCGTGGNTPLYNAALHGRLPVIEVKFDPLNIRVCPLTIFSICARSTKLPFFVYLMLVWILHGDFT